MIQDRLDSALRTLDAYVNWLRTRPPGTKQVFVWELERVALFRGDNDRDLATPNSPYRDVIVRHARAAGCKVTLTDDGYSISL